MKKLLIFLPLLLLTACKKEYIEAPVTIRNHELYEVVDNFYQIAIYNDHLTFRNYEEMGSDTISTITYRDENLILSQMYSTSDTLYLRIENREIMKANNTCCSDTFSFNLLRIY